MGGLQFRDSDAFIEAAKRDVQKLMDLGLRSGDSILDWGCGAGRLAVGLLETSTFSGSYLGVDVQRPLINWANRHLSRPGISFEWVDLANARYNPAGARLCEIPVETRAFDVLYAYSVFSHMQSADLRGYLAEIRRVLRPNGFAWVTAFVELGVENEVENPEDYGPMTWHGPLHCIRYNSNFFAELASMAGLLAEFQEHGAETDGQTAIVLRPN